MTFRQTIWALLWSASAAFADDVPQHSSEVVDIEILPGWQVSDGAYMSAIRLRLAAGWKTYWRAPGEGGIPTTLTPTVQDGILSAEIKWPRPSVFRSAGLRALGYFGEVVLPVEITATEGATRLSGRLSFGVCAEICVPVSVPIALELPRTKRTDPRITDALALQPRAIAPAVTCTVTSHEKMGTLKVDLRPDVGWPSADVALELEDPRIWVDEPMLTREADTWSVSARLTGQARALEAVRTSQVRITLMMPRDAVELFCGLSD